MPHILLIIYNLRLILATPPASILDEKKVLLQSLIYPKSTGNDSGMNFNIAAALHLSSMGKGHIVDRDWIL